MAIPSYPALDPGTYIFDPKGGGYPNNSGGASGGNGPGGPTYVLPANTSTGVSVTSSLSVYSKYVIASEVYTIPSASPYQITVQHGGIQQILEQNGNTTDSVIYQYPADGSQGASGATGGVRYYPSGNAFTSKGENGTPTAAGEYGWSNTGGQGIYTFTSADAGQQVVIRYLYLSPDYQQFAPTAEAIDFAMGNLGQSPSTYMSSKHPDQAVGYSHTALAELDAGYIGASGTLPDYRYEVSGYSVVGGGTLDAHTLDCAYTLLTDSLVGVGVPTDVIDQASWYNNASSAQNWLDSQQFYISEALASPQSCGSVIGRWLEAFNVAAFWSEGLLKVVPYGDQQTSGTTAYVPILTTVASFTDDDYIAGDNADPVQMSRTSWADAYNRVQVTYSNRANAYYPDLVYEDESGSIERFGLRIKAPDSYPFITTWQLAQNVANMRLKRYTMVRNTYQFTVPITYEYVEPMDLVALTDTRLGLDELVVRVTKVANDPAKGLQITCEDFPGNGYAMPVSHPKAVVPPSSPTHGTAPAGGTASLILQASNISQNQTGTKIYIWAGPDSPGMSWGGCTIFASLDGSTYQQLGGVPHAAGLYQLSASLPSVAANPTGALGLTHDTTSTLSVIPDQVGASAQIQTTAGLTQWDAETDYAAGVGAIWDGLPWVANFPNSGSQPSAANPNWSLVPAVSPAGATLSSISDTAAANLGNLCAVIATSGNAPSAVEFLSFGTVGASGTNGYALTDLYRGALGTTIGSFAAGSAMVAFNEASATWDVPPGLAGQTVYFRFVPWNQFGQATQDLSLAETVEFVIADSGSVGVWEGLGGPIGDVIQNNGGKGELIVNPAGGVSGELPYPNHASQVQSVITSGSQISGGTEVSAITKSALTMQEIHDGVSATISGYGSTGLDNIPSGSTYLQNAGQSGQNALENPSFEFGPAPGSGDLAAGWLDQTGNVYGFIEFWETSTTEPHTGSHDIDLEIPSAGLSVPANGSIYAAIINRKKVPAFPGQVWRVGGWTNIQSSTAPAAGLSLQVSIFARAEYSDGSYVQFGGYGNAGTAITDAWNVYSTTFTVPTFSGKAFLGLDTWLIFQINNSNSTATTAASGAWGVRFDDVSLVRCTDYANEIVDGQTDSTGVQWSRLKGVNTSNEGTLAYVNDDAGQSGTFSGRSAKVVQFFNGQPNAGWYMLGTWTFPADGAGHTMVALGNGGQGYNHSTTQQAKVEIICRSGDGATDGVAPNISGVSYFGLGTQNGFVAGVKLASHGGSTSPSQNQWDLYVDLAVWCAAHWVFELDPGSSFAWVATDPSTPNGDPGPASTTVIVGTGGYLHDANADLFGALGINGISETALALSDLHDRVSSTINGHAGTGLGNIPDGADSSGNQWNKLSGVAPDNTGLTLGYSGGSQLAVSSGGSWTISGAAVGRQIRQVIVTAPTVAGYNDQTTINFSSLTRQGGAPLPTFGAAPDVGLIAFDPPSGLNQLWASNITTSGFLLNAKTTTSGSNQNTVGMSAVGTSGGTSTGSYTVPAGYTATQVQVTVTAHATTLQIGGKSYYPFSVTVTPTVDGVQQASFDVNGQTNGGTYHNSAAYSISVAAGSDVTLSVAITGPGSTYVSSITCSAVETDTGGSITGVDGVNFYAIVGEEWNG